MVLCFTVFCIASTVKIKYDSSIHGFMFYCFLYYFYREDQVHSFIRGFMFYCYLYYFYREDQVHSFIHGFTFYCYLYYFYREDHVGQFYPWFYVLLLFVLFLP